MVKVPRAARLAVPVMDGAVILLIPQGLTDPISLRVRDITDHTNDCARRHHRRMSQLTTHLIGFLKEFFR